MRRILHINYMTNSDLVLHCAMWICVLNRNWEMYLWHINIYRIYLSDLFIGFLFLTYLQLFAFKLTFFLKRSLTSVFLWKTFSSENPLHICRFKKRYVNPNSKKLVPLSLLCELNKLVLNLTDEVWKAKPLNASKDQAFKFTFGKLALNLTP